MSFSFPGIRRMATSGSNGGGNDAMLIAAGMGILGATGMMVKFAF